MPVVALMIVVFIFKLYVPGGVSAHLTGAVITYVLVIIPLALANYHENRKRLVSRLKNLEEILEELSSD